MILRPVIRVPDQAADRIRLLSVSRIFVLEDSCGGGGGREKKRERTGIRKSSDEDGVKRYGSLLSPSTDCHGDHRRRGETGERRRGQGAEGKRGCNDTPWRGFPRLRLSAGIFAQATLWRTISRMKGKKEGGDSEIGGRQRRLSRLSEAAAFLCASRDRDSIGWVQKKEKGEKREKGEGTASRDWTGRPAFLNINEERLFLPTGGRKGREKKRGGGDAGSTLEQDRVHVLRYRMSRPKEEEKGRRGKKRKRRRCGRRCWNLRRIILVNLRSTNLAFGNNEV